MKWILAILPKSYELQMNASWYKMQSLSRSTRSLKRIHLFEIEDLPNCPAWMRQYITLFLVGLHRLLGTSRRLLPLLERCLAHAPELQLIDLCSGGGGPMVDAWKLLIQKPAFRSLKLTLTDLFPNQRVATLINASREAGLSYRLEAVDATAVGGHLSGLRTMICAFHHMPPPVAQAILNDAYTKRQPICIYELSDNAFPTIFWWITLPFGVLLALLVTPFIRPLSWGQLIFTYLIPILPFAIAWDTAVSNARVYTEADMLGMLEHLRSNDYRWEIGRQSKFGFPARMIYLLGLPQSDTRSSHV